MAPEREDNLALTDLQLRNGKLEGVTKYWTVPTGKEYGIDWDSHSKPNNYAPLHKGVAYYYVGSKSKKIQPNINDLQARDLGNSEYIWSEGDLGEAMMILILPEGYTLNSSDPIPKGAKVFSGRLALYWIFTGKHKDDVIKWKMNQSLNDLTAEVQRLNKDHADKLDFLREKVSNADNVPSWFSIAGVVFGAITLLFLMMLIVLSLYSREIPETSRFILVAFLALSIGLSSTFLGGTAAARGVVSMPFFKESPMSFAVTGGIAVFIIVLVLGFALYGR